MSTRHVQAPKFSLSFFLPKYWLIWLSIIFLYCISWLPYKVQRLLGKGLGLLLSIAAKNRIRVAHRNLLLCFPNMSQAQRDELLKANIEHAGMAILEAGMGWWWPDWRVRKHCKVEGYEHVQAILDKGKGVLGLAIHNMNLEMGCRIAGLQHPSVAFYRKHNNPLMEYMQYYGRARSNRYMIHKRDVRGLIQALDEGELCLYLPDQDYGPKRSVFVPFYAVPETASTTGTLLFANSANCETVFIVSLRTADGYLVRFVPGLQDFPSGDDKQDVARVNKMVESLVDIAPEQYLWMHKRFKTRPQKSDPSLYQ